MERFLETGNFINITMIYPITSLKKINRFLKIFSVALAANIAIFWSFSCGNPKITYYLTKVGSASVIEKSKGKVIRESHFQDPDEYEDESSEANRSPEDDWITIYKNDELGIWFDHADMVKELPFFEEIGLEIIPGSRLPNVYYFRYNVKYKGAKPLIINFYDSYFEDEFGKKYRPISRSKFKEKFTSPSYDWIKYDKLHGVYKKKKNDTKKKYHLLNKKPYRNIHVNSNSNIFQIVAYDFFPLSSKRYSLFLRIKLEDVTTEIKTPLYYLSSREDIPDEVK